MNGEDFHIMSGKSSRLKPRILLYADQPNWVFDINAREIANELQDEFDFEICYSSLRPALGEKDFDLFFVFYWGEESYKYFLGDRRRIIKQISSQRWEHHALYPVTREQFAEQYMNDAGVVVVHSLRMKNAFEHLLPVIHACNGFDSRLFHETPAPSGTLKLGWAGNAADDSKGLNDILLPACGTAYDLEIAGGSLSYSEMPGFYSGIDVINIASLAEGDPKPLIEAMACGCFPVCTDVGIAPELIRHEENGLIVNRSAEAFRAAFDWCAERLDAIRKLRPSLARQMAETRTWATTGQGWRKVFRQAWDLLNSDEPDYTPRSDPAPLLQRNLKALKGKDGHTFATVAGGLCGLHYLSALNPERIVFFDTDPVSLELARLAVELACASGSREGFISRFYSRPVMNFLADAGQFALSWENQDRYMRSWMDRNLIKSTLNLLSARSGRTYIDSVLPRLYEHVRMGIQYEGSIAPCANTITASSFFYGLGWLESSESFEAVTDKLRRARMEFVKWDLFRDSLGALIGDDEPAIINIGSADREFPAKAALRVQSWQDMNRSLRVIGARNGIQARDC